MSDERSRAQRSPTEREIDDLLALLGQPDLSLREAEHVFARLQPGPTFTREQIVDRLLAVLETVQEPAREQAESSAPGACAGEQEIGAEFERRFATPDTALILLSILGDETVAPRLMDLIEKPWLSDDFKLKLISIVHEFDPERDPDDLLSRLHKPYKAMQHSHRMHLRRLQSPLELGIWLDVMAEEMVPEARMSFASASADADEPLAVPLLICMCYDRDPAVALAAMDAVERYKDERALPALEELAERYPDEAVRDEALKAADRLRIRASLTPQVDPKPLPPLYLCYLTTIDGTGSQAALLVREILPEMLRVAQAVFDDETGIEYCFGTDILEHELDDLLDDLVARGLSPVDVPYAQFATTIERACETTWNAASLPPASFVAWREWLLWEWAHGEKTEHNLVAQTEPTDEQLFLGALSAHERAQFLHDCPELLLQDEFAGWLFSEDELYDLGDAFWELVEQGQGLAPEVSAVRDLVRQVVQRSVTDHERGLIRNRLWRVAPLLHDLYLDQEVWQWAVVAAQALADTSPLPPKEHPLLLAMAANTLENIVGAEVIWRS